MSSVIVNVLIPVLAALGTGRFRVRDAWIWSWATLAADLDYIGWILHVTYDVPNVHRALFHNLWTVVGLAALAWWGWRRWNARAGGTVSEWIDAQPGWVLVAFYHGAAVFLDVLAGGITLFWPVLQTSVFWNLRLVIDTSRPVPAPQLESQTGTYAGPPDVSPVYTWVTGEELGILLIYLTALGLSLAQAWRNRETDRVRRARPVRVPAARDGDEEPTTHP